MMRTDQAHMLASELASHRYWRVESVGPAPETVTPGPAEGVWVRLRHRTRPAARFVVPVWPASPIRLARMLSDVGQRQPCGLSWYTNESAHTEDANP